MGDFMAFVITSYLHYVGMALLFSALIIETILFRPRVDGRVARQLAAVDAMYGLSALAVLSTGLLRVFIYAKPAAYYGHNFLFHIKVTLFVVVFALSIYPTIRFIRERRAADGQQVDFPPVMGKLIRVELVLLAIIPLLAVMMGHGYGVTG
jgi:putative membrane protein